MQHNINSNTDITEKESKRTDLKLKCPLFVNHYKDIYTSFIPYNNKDFIKIEGDQNSDNINKWMIKKAKQSVQYKELFDLYEKIILPDSKQFFNLSSFQLLSHIKLNRMHNLIYKETLGSIADLKEIKKTNFFCRFDNKKVYDESDLIDNLNINNGKHWYFLTDNIYANLHNPNCYIKIKIELFNNEKIIQFLDIFYKQMGFTELVTEYSRYVMKEFCEEVMELSENKNSSVCMFSFTTHNRDLFNGESLNCNIFNTIGYKKNTTPCLSDEGIELVKYVEKETLFMHDFSILEPGFYVWNNGKIFTIGGTTGENISFKGLRLGIE